MLKPVFRSVPAVWSTWSVKRHTQLSRRLTSAQTQMGSTHSERINSRHKRSFLSEKKKKHNYSIISRVYMFF